MTLTLIIWAVCAVLFLWWEWNAINEWAPKATEELGNFFAEGFVRQFAITFLIIIAPIGIVYNLSQMLLAALKFPLRYKALCRLRRMKRKTAK
jgi:hypothetical protein